MELLRFLLSSIIRKVESEMGNSGTNTVDSAVASNEAVKSTLAMFSNFSVDDLITDAAVLFWESHTDNSTDKKRIQATSDLIYKVFDIQRCDAYEVRTGYLSRYNFLNVDASSATQDDWNEAVAKGLKSEHDWVKRCDPYLPGFKLQEWNESISKENNPYYEQCKDLLRKEMERDESFKNAFYLGVGDYADRHGANRANGAHYMLEEMAWIFSLVLVYWKKPVYLIHVGNDNPGIRDMFKRFSNLSKSVKWLSPRCRDDVEFVNLADFLMYYRCNNYAGCSYAVEHRDVMSSLCKDGQIYGQRKIA